MCSSSYPTVDVIIPIFNGAETITKTIESVLQQTHLPNRIIVVDDGSTDNSISIINNIGSSLIDVLKNKKKGVSSARNTGIQASQAQVIAFLDDDDVWLPEKLAQQLEVLKQEPEAHVVYCGMSLIDNNDKDLANSYCRPYLKGYIFEDLLLFDRIIYGSASGVMVYRAALDETGCFDENLSYGEDYDLWIRLAHTYIYTYNPQLLVKIRINTNSVTRKNKAEKKTEFLLQYFFMLEKWAHKKIFTKVTIRKVQSKILLLSFRLQWGLSELHNFHNGIRQQTPNLCSYLGTNFSQFIFRLILAIPSATRYYGMMIVYTVLQGQQSVGIAMFKKRR